MKSFITYGFIQHLPRLFFYPVLVVPVPAPVVPVPAPVVPVPDPVRVSFFFQHKSPHDNLAYGVLVGLAESRFHTRSTVFLTSLFLHKEIKIYKYQSMNGTNK
jgi:hypothetical protein